MLQLAHLTWSPSATSVSISTAVWMVMCSDPVILAPRSGWERVYSSRTAISPGISCSASRISFRPNSASDKSATLNAATSVGIERSFRLDLTMTHRRYGTCAGDRTPDTQFLTRDCKIPCHAHYGSRAAPRHLATDAAVPGLSRPASAGP